MSNPKGTLYNKEKRVKGAMKVETATCPYHLTEQEMAVLVAYCEVYKRTKKFLSFTDAYLTVFPTTSLVSAHIMSSRIYVKLKNNGAYDWFLENYGLSLRVAADSLKEGMRAEEVETVLFPDTSWDYKSKPAHVTRLLAARSALRLHGADSRNQTQEPQNNKTLAELIEESEEAE